MMPLNKKLRNPFICTTYKECECGCGTLILEKDSQYRKMRFANGHQRCRPTVTALCACRCGGLVTGYSKGQPKRYLRGHNWRGKRRNTWLEPTKILCACGCGEMIDNIRRHKQGAPYRVKFQVGHMWRGKENHFWQGGKTEEAKRFKQSGAYRRWRKAVFERDNYTCQICGIRNEKGVGKTIEMHPDHIKPFAHFPELRTELSNGRTLCAECHRKTPTYGGGSRRSVLDKNQILQST